jgi:transcriptional regulator with XRE-family HTH domain
MKKSTHTKEYRRLREILVDARNHADLSQRGLAAILRVTPSWVAKVESGERRIDVIEMCWYLKACGNDPAEVVPGIVAQLATAQQERLK